MPDNSSPTPLSEPSFFILLSLASGPRHGYAVLKDAEALGLSLHVFPAFLAQFPGAIHSFPVT
jgi:hypothetical protein